MTVSDIIKELSTYPYDMEVFISNTCNENENISVFDISAFSVFEPEDKSPNILVIEFDDDLFINPSLISEN